MDAAPDSAPSDPAASSEALPVVVENQDPPAVKQPIPEATPAEPALSTSKTAVAAASPATSSTSQSSIKSFSSTLTHSRPRRGGISFLSGDPMKIGLIGKKGSLATVVRALKQKKLEKKMGTLEKSRLDWVAFKKQQGIEEELQSAVKSKNGYLERQEFLQRTDLREFEYEKDIRAKRRRTANSEN